MGDLADHHVDFVVVCDCNDHLAIGGTCAFQHIRVRSVPYQPAHVEFNRDLVDQVRVLVDDGDLMFFARQPPGNALAHASGAADQNMHLSSLSACGSAIVPHACGYSQSL